MALSSQSMQKAEGGRKEGMGREKRRAVEDRGEKREKERGIACSSV